MPPPSSPPATPSMVGMMGKLAASMPFMLASKLAQRRLSVCVRVDNSMSMRSGGRLLTNSVSRRAGTVIEPSSSTLAPIQQVTPISRLVAASRSWLSRASSMMLASTGMVLRDDTARPTIASPFARFSCRQLTRTAPSVMQFSRSVCRSISNDFRGIGRRHPEHTCHQKLRQSIAQARGNANHNAGAWVKWGLRA